MKRDGMLENKIAVIYGAAGGIGAAVARAFADEGATVFATGRRLAPVEALVAEIASSGGSARAAEVDALDEPAVDSHLESVIGAAGRIDISFNAVGFPCVGILGVPLVELDAGQFSRPLTNDTRAYFLTARLAARRMIPRRSGVILTVTGLPSRLGFPLNGGYGPAQAAKEALTRSLSGELAPHGIRVIGLRPHGIPESATMRDVYELKAKARHGLTWDQFTGFLGSTTHAGRGSTLAEVAGAAAFLASDRASGFTGTSVNLSLGALDD